MEKVRITLIGAGQVGCQIAMLLQQTPWASVTFTDVRLSRAQGRCLDIAQASAVHGMNGCIQAAPLDESIVGAQVIVVTAGIPRAPDMTREDLLKRNAQTIKSIGDTIYAKNPNAFVILVTNPVDILTWVLVNQCQLDPKKTIGLSGTLDGGRFSYFLSQALNLHPAQICPMVIGAHSDTMVILPRYTTVGGINLPTLKDMGLIHQEKIDHCIEQAIYGGVTIIKLLENASTAYAPAASVFEMIETIVFDQRKIMCCSHLLSDVYDTNGLCLSVPVVITSKGIEQTILLDLNETERKQWNKCVDGVGSMVLQLQ